MKIFDGKIMENFQHFTLENYAIYTTKNNNNNNIHKLHRLSISHLSCHLKFYLSGRMYPFMITHELTMVYIANIPYDTLVTLIYKEFFTDEL